MLLLAVDALEPLLEQIAFVGGCATGLLITDPAAPPVRATTDVDVIVEIASYTDFIELEGQLEQLGLRRCTDPGAPICRWQTGAVKIDVMPTETAVLGFSNIWYGPGIANAPNIHINDRIFRLITAPYFLGTKLEAFYGRGKGDFAGSHDLEDIITVVDGRIELIDEVSQSPVDLRRYLALQFTSLLNNPEFIDSIPGHLLPDEASQARVSIIIARLSLIAKMDLG